MFFALNTGVGWCVCVYMYMREELCAVSGDPSLAFQPFPWYLGTGLFYDGVFLVSERQLSVNRQTVQPLSE